MGKCFGTNNASTHSNNASTHTGDEYMGSLGSRLTQLYKTAELQVAEKFSIVTLECDENKTLCVYLPKQGPFFPIGANSSYTLEDLRQLLHEQVEEGYLPINFRFGYVKTYKKQTIHVQISQKQEKLMCLSNLYPEKRLERSFSLPKEAPLSVCDHEGDIRIMLENFSKASLRIIGEGSDSVVRLFNERCCIKTISKRENFIPGLVLQEIIIHKYLAESKLAPKLFAVFEDDSLIQRRQGLEYGAHLVMERGRCDLHTLLTETKHLGEEQVASLFLRILKLIEKVHQSGIMLGDVKPENFLLMLPSWSHKRAVKNGGDWDISKWHCQIDDMEGQWELVVTDFGLSEFAGKNTQFSRVCGTPGYCAPEVLRRSYTMKADNWSAGIMLFSFVTGKCPFEAESFQSSVEKTFSLDVSKCLEDVEFKTVSQETKALILGLLDKNPETRMSLSSAIKITQRWLKNYRAQTTLRLDTLLQKSTDDEASSASSHSLSASHTVFSVYQQSRANSYCSLRSGDSRNLNSEHIVEEVITNFRSVPVIAIPYVPRFLSPKKPFAQVTVPERRFEKVPVKKKDSFLSYNWGKNGSNREKVQRINDALKSRGIVTWFDSQGDMEGLLDSAMAEGIDNSSVIIVFLTSEYIRKCTIPDDNCAKEFRFAMLRHGVLGIIPVVMEKSLLNQKTWRGTVGLNLGNSIYVDATKNANQFNEFVDELSNRIIKMTNALASTS